MTGIILIVAFVLSVIWIEESYPPVLLSRKAHRLRLETKNWAIHAKSEEMGITWKEMSKKYMVTPWEMLVDPTAFLMNLYSAFTYAIIYLWVTLLRRLQHWIDEVWRMY